MLSSFLKNEPQKNKFSQVWNNIEGERERAGERSWVLHPIMPASSD